MPLDKLFRREAEDARFEAETISDEIRKKMLEIHNELEVYDTPAWSKVEQKLDALARKSVDEIMRAEDHESMILARERARVVAQLRSEPDELRARLEDLRRQLREVQGETDG